MKKIKLLLLIIISLGYQGFAQGVITSPDN
jgi:hypothetical protein